MRSFVLTVALLCVSVRHVSSQGATGGVMEVDVDEVLDMGEEVFETIESQRKRDTMDRKDLEDQCVSMREAIREAIDVREKALGTLESYEQKNIDAFESSLEDAKGKNEPLFESIVASLDDVNKETHKTIKEWEDMKKSNSAQIKEDTLQIKILLDQLSNVQDADSASAISTIRGTVSTMKHRFDGDAPASSGLTERDRKLENTKNLEEFVDEGHDAQLERFRNRIKDHARVVNEDLKRLKDVLKDINDACSSMKNAYDDRNRVVDGILVILRNALRDAAPGVYKSRVDRSFEDYIQSAVSIQAEQTASKLAEYTSVPMSTQAELDSLGPQVAAQAMKLRKQSRDMIQEASNRVISRRRDAQSSDKIRDQRIEAYDKASELLGNAKEDLRVALEGAHVGHDAIGKLVGVDLSSPDEVFGATAGTFDGVKDEDEKELLNKAMKHQVGVYEIESLRTKAESLLRMQKEEADKVKEAEKSAEHAHKMLQAAMQALEYKKLIWGKSQKAAEDALKLLGRPVEPFGPIALTDEALEQEREQARVANQRLENQVKELQDDGRDLLGDIDVAVNHLDTIAATGGGESSNPTVPESDVDEIDELIGSYGNLRKGREQAEEKAKNSEHDSDRAVNELTAYMSGLTSRRRR